MIQQNDKSYSGVASKVEMTTKKKTYAKDRQQMEPPAMKGFAGWKPDHPVVIVWPKAKSIQVPV